MDNYAIFRMGKLKTSKDLDDAFKHNERFYHVENADPSKMQDNIELIDTFGLTYEDLFNSQMTELKTMGVPARTIRKDAVKGLEVILTYSKEMTDKLDVEEWANESMKWVDKQFNPPDHKARFTDPETGKEREITVDNIKHAIVHMDESKPHLHVFVVPIDDKGNLNSHYYNYGRERLKELHTDYAKAMEPFGLQRGEEHSVATPEQMSRYYNYIKKNVEAELPEPMPGESIKDYRMRANECYKTALCNHRNEIVKKDQEIIHIKSEAEKKVLGVKEEQRQEHAFFTKVNEALSQEELSIERERQIAQMVQEVTTFKAGLSHCTDIDSARAIHEEYQRIIAEELQREIERKEEERKKKEKERYEYER